MEFCFKPIEKESLDIINTWDYDGFIEKVIMKPYYESLKTKGKLIGPGGSEGFVAYSDQEPVGLFEYIVDGKQLEIGLALRPDLVGRGYGKTFVEQGIKFGTEYYPGTINSIKLTVDVDNKPAIRVYEKAGFKLIGQEGNEVKMHMFL
ncbi:GNAT family N-acetyltransferase [Halobacillus yeomjeoni]|uniref:GNAT family N-acetyltransferase n=1 Tax=Halobacillus yeomjeoni TaxID=311194 RepID=UPI001CD71E3A|nr:GNAT family protein [Halobacillus yeomjeoni]MCA0984766.1 GNAT family N-acetyltransferase [Halobacillus yeomjeoni]